MNNSPHNEASANKIEPIVAAEIRECPRGGGRTKLALCGRGLASLMHQSTCIQLVTIVNSVIRGAVIQCRRAAFTARCRRAAERRIALSA